MKKLLILLLASSLAHGYDTEQFLDELMAPIDTTQAHPYLMYGGGATAFLVLFREDLVEPFQDDYAKDKPMGDASHFGDLMGQVVPNLLYMGGMYLDYSFNGNQDSYKRFMHMFKTTAYAGGVTTVLKRIVRQKRPHGGDTNSFPSGHTTTAFAFASVIGTQHDWYWGAAAYSLASFVAMSRINDNEHYLHDVFAGATIGISYGVAFYYDQHSVKKDKDANTYMFLPVQDGIYAGLTSSF